MLHFVADPSLHSSTTSIQFQKRKQQIDQTQSLSNTRKMSDSILSIPLLIAAAVLVLTTWLLSVWNQNRRLPPGPWGLPLFGYHPFLSDEPHKDFTALSKKYGPVFSYRTLGGRLMVVLNGQKLIKEILVNRSEEFLGRPHGNSLVTWVSDGLGMTQEEGEEWREQRRFFLATAKNYGFGKLELEDRLHDEYSEMLEDLRKTKGQDTDVQFHIAYANNSIISHLLFSKKFPKEAFYKDMLGSFKDIVHLFVGKRHILVGYMLDIILMFSSGLKRAKKAKQLFQKLTYEIVKEHMKALDPDHPKDYVDEYLLHRQKLLKGGKDKEGTFTIPRLEANALNLFLEGTESVSYTIANLLAGLSKHEEAQKAIQVELDAEIGRERLPSWADRAKLPKLEATIQELFRMRAPFFVSTMYSNFKETTIEGYRIPARSTIVYNIGSMHFDPESYPDPQKFDPGRFLDEDGKRLKRDGPIPYGIGKRSCIGESLAQMEVFLVFGCILQNFTLRPGDTEETLRVIPRI